MRTAYHVNHRQGYTHWQRRGRTVANMTPSVTHLPSWRLTTMALLLLMSGTCGVEAARILGIFPTPSISHQLPYQAVMKALAARGHEVTVISTDPLKEPVANYTDIDLSFSYPTFRKTFNFADMAEMSVEEHVSTMTRGIPTIVDEQLGSAQLQDFLRTNPKFDMVFLEWFWYEAYFGVYHHVGSPPLIGIISLGGIYNSYKAIGNPVNPAYSPDPLLRYSDHMTFFERVHNTYITLWMTYQWHYVVFPSQEALMRKYFGAAPPPVADTERNMSLLVLHNHWSTEYVRPLLPGIVQITGNHVKEHPLPLPKELQQWMDEAEDGVIYFSLGTNVMSKDLPLEKRSAILKAFERLKQRVLWKWEEEELPGRPSNVRVSKWLPQQSILAHPKVRLFIMQGGLQSLQEATFHAVPLIGIPFMGDQQYNVGKIVSAGIGKRLEIRDVTEESFYRTITSILDGKSYKENIQRLSAVFREHKASSMENGIWWIEYVLRHNGAPHLRSAAQDLTWYQYLLLDVAAVALAALAIFLYVIYAIVRTVFKLLFGNRQHTNVNKSKMH